MACVKVFLCSNPEDCVEERKFLRENVFPKLRDHCRRTHGVDFRVIDPYEGLEPSTWPTQKVNLQLIEECRTNSLGPYFVGLVDEHYGEGRLPEQVELSEFLMLLQMCEQMDLSCDVLEKCYRRDENTIPPSFCLLSQPEQKMEDTSWNDVLATGNKIIHSVVTKCVLEGTIEPERAQKYFRSSLEKELRFALEGRSCTDIKRCLCYVNKTGKKADRRKQGNDFQDPSVRLKQLRDDFLPNLVRTHKALVYTVTAECDAQKGYAEDLGYQLYSDLQKVIDRSLVKEKNQTHDSFSKQGDLCQTLSRLYIVEREEVKHVRAYLDQDTNHPFILTGGPCTGKSVFLAHCANQVQSWMKDRDPVVIVQFVDYNSSLKQLLTSICHQLALSYQQPYSICPKDIFELKDTFNNLLTTSSLSSHPLILIIDGLDQMPNLNRPLDLTWLPKILPSSVKLFISSAPTKAGLLSAIKTHYRDSSLFYELKPLNSKNCNQMLTTLLLAANRRITSGQQMYVNQAFKKCSLPLFVELLHRQVCGWSSESEVTPNTLVPGVHANITRFLGHLEEKHGEVLVRKTLQYLTLSRHGLTEAELTDVLSCDDEVLLAFLPVKDAVRYKLRVPEVVVEMLLLDLKGFLMVRNTSGTKTLSWVSRHFNLVIHGRSLSSNKRENMHSLMADYFSGRWACGTTKPLITTSFTKKMYTDRQVPGQPWMFRPPTSNLPTSSSFKCKHLNVRKLLELPFHLMHSGNTEALGHLMVSHEFLHTMFQASLVQELVFWLEKTSQRVFPRELRLLLTILKTSTCWPNDSIADLASITQARLFPFINVFPELEGLVNQARHESTIRNIGLDTLLLPTPSVPATHWVLPAAEVSPIIMAAVSQCGSVVVIQDNGSASVWNGSDSEGFRLSQSSELQFADVSCSANVVLLSTQSGQLLVWDINASSYLQELQTQHRETGQRDVVTIGGILVSNGKIFVLFEGRSSISVFAGGIEVDPLQCPSGVTCMSCFEEAHMVCCGQNEGTVSMFDSQSGHPLASFKCPTGMSLFDLILHENVKTITCVDSTGSVFVWDLKTIANPVLVIESLNCTKEEVLNTDHSESNLLLICKRQQIQMIASLLLDVEAQLSAPRGKTFVQAVLDPEEHFIVALMRDCLLLVWNWVSGQCVLSLDTGDSQSFKLIKLKDFPYLTAITSTSVVNWDWDLVSVAASTPKSGEKVVKIVVEAHGEHFYATDRSEIVRRWTMLNGKQESCFLHHGPVETMALSADGTHFVTIASGDVYVWNTHTNENAHRIQGSQASRVLLTPKGNFAVTLSETGLSRVWKLCSGHVVCSVHHKLRDAVISPESTFLLGINKGDLLAVSLWSGHISRRFSGSEWSEVVAFVPLSEHPDYVVLITIAGELYSWRVTEETVCHQFQFPESFECDTQLFKFSSDGHYGIAAGAEAEINVLDVYHGKLCSLKTEGPVQQPLVDICGKYVAYICNPSARCQNRSCDLHNKQILVAIRVTDGQRVGKFYLCGTPSALTLSEEMCVFVGFEDGSVGVYAISDTDCHISRPKCERTELMCPFDEPQVWLPLSNPDLTCVEAASELL